MLQFQNQLQLYECTTSLLSKMPFEFKLWHGALSLVIYVVLFYIGAYVAKRHLSKISLQEAIKRGTFN